MIRKIVFVLAGESGDEGKDYLSKLKNLIKQAGIRALFIGDRIKSERMIIDGERQYLLWDAFRNADFVTYPTKLEGFGNQFLETMAFRKPTLVNRYPVYKADIEPLGFQVVNMDGVITTEIVEEVRELLKKSELIKSMVDNNFEIARKNFSYEATAERMFRLGLIPDTGVSGQRIGAQDLIRLFDPQFSD